MTVELKKGYYIDSYYDKNTKSYITTIKDKESNQIGEASYSGNMTDRNSDIQYLKEIFYDENRWEDFKSGSYDNTESDSNVRKFLNSTDNEESLVEESLDSKIKDTKKKTKKAKLPALSTLSPIMPDAAAGIATFNSGVGLSEDYIGRDELIKRLKAMGYKYNYPKYTDQELYEIYKKNLKAQETKQTFKKLKAAEKARKQRYKDKLSQVKYDEDSDTYSDGSYYKDGIEFESEEAAREYFGESMNNKFYLNDIHKAWDIEEDSSVKTLNENLNNSHDFRTITEGLKYFERKEFNENCIDAELESLYEGIKNNLDQEDIKKLGNFLKKADSADDVATYIRGLLSEDVSYDTSYTYGSENDAYDTSYIYDNEDGAYDTSYKLPKDEGDAYFSSDYYDGGYDYLDEDINRYSDAVPYENRKYWYFTTHGVGPGTIPSDLNILEVKEGQNDRGTWGDFICLDGVLNTGELRKYDLRELAPSIEESLNESCDGWIAIYNGKKLEIPKTDAKDLYDAKQKAIRELKVPKSKVGLLTIRPGYNESLKEDLHSTALGDIDMAIKQFEDYCFDNDYEMEITTTGEVDGYYLISGYIEDQVGSDKNPSEILDILINNLNTFDIDVDVVSDWQTNRLYKRMVFQVSTKEKIPQTRRRNTRTEEEFFKLAGDLAHEIQQVGFELDGDVKYPVSPNLMGGMHLQIKNPNLLFPIEEAEGDERLAFKLMVDDLKDIQNIFDKFEEDNDVAMTFSFGPNKDMVITGGVDIR